jgi:hypothetical protein
MNRSFRHDAQARPTLIPPLLTSLSALGLWAFGQGCLPGEGADSEEPSSDEPAAEAHAKNAAALTRATSCEEVLSRIHASTIERLTARAEELRHPPEYYNGEPGIIVDDAPLAPPPSGEPNNPGAPTPGTDVPEQDVGEPSAGPGDGSGFSDTTGQVRDVDEADVIKTDGDYLYVLQGSSLVKLRAWPAEQTQTLSAVAIEGSPHDMFVSDGKAVVFSSVYGQFGPATPPGYGGGYYYPYYYPSYTKISVLDVEPETPELLRESYLEGYYVSSRRHDSVVRAVLQDGYKAPSLDSAYIEYFTPFGEPYRQQDIDAQVDAWLERTIWAVTESELGDWLPRQFTTVDGQLIEQEPNCADYYQPELDLSQSGVTQIFSLDLDSDDGTSALPSTTVLARAERVYANGRVVLLAQTSYGTVETEYSESTNLHQFELDGSGAEYVASGVLPGFVQSQFSLDEYDGTVRVSTTENRWNLQTGESQGPKNRVFTLQADDGDLNVLGQTEVFGENEQIFATRFIGDLGYVVTFRQIDPLFVVDLSDPAQPRVAGELHIPGFSNFLFPLDAEHLLSIGRDATEDGRSLGIALQIFDVSDPSAPQLAHKYAYTGDAYSEANFDHRGITFHPDGGRVAFPIYDYLTGQSSIEVLDVGVQSGFTRRGALAPTLADMTLEECVIWLGYGEDALDGWLGDEIEAWPEYADYLLAQCRGSEQMRRGVLRDETVFGVSNQAVYAQGVAELDQPPAIRAELPPAYYYGGGAMAGAAGAAGAAGSGPVEDIGEGMGGMGEGGAAGAAGAGGAAGEPMP